MALATTDKAVRTQIRGLLETASESPTRVVPRWLLDFKHNDWAAPLRSITVDGKIDGWLITRTSMSSRRIGIGKYEHRWTYALWYFRSYAQGNNNNNSEDSVNAMLDQVTAAFEDSEQLGFTGDEIDEHSGFSAKNIDTIDNQLHMVIGELTVTLTSQ